ncbi:MAG TPA: YhfC family glutamic-type intramembrane protease, partial [Chloroflexota bacterium]|nr:YhfC family glutamic-type intramembrane protease [Chloroflexota bacterium]
KIQGSLTLTLIWLAFLALTAGLFEEVGRYVGYRWLFRGQDKTWPRAVMYGVGHAALESWFIMVITVVGVINIIALSRTNLATLPPAVQAPAAQQLAALSTQPVWLPLLGAWERLWTLPVQVALSVLVLQVFRQGSLRWLWLAILAHAFVDFTALAVGLITAIPGFPRTLLIEGLVAVFGIIALGVIVRFRGDGGSGG